MKKHWEVLKIFHWPVILVYMTQKLKIGLADKYEIEACCHYLWNHNMTIKLVGTDIVLT